MNVFGDRVGNMGNLCELQQWLHPLVRLGSTVTNASTSFTKRTAQLPLLPKGQHSYQCYQKAAQLPALPKGQHS